MNNFAKFLSVNGLKRKDIASFLGVSGAFITQLSSGDRPIPAEKLATIKANANWDTSMFDKFEVVAETDPVGHMLKDRLLILLEKANNANEILLEMNKLKEARIQELSNQLIEAMAEITRLQDEMLSLKSKGGNAGTAEGSSFVNVG